MRTVLAVDGGNSKTDLALVGEDGTVLGTARAGGFKPQSRGVGPAVDVVSGPARALLDEAGLARADLLSSFLAGADFPAEEEVLRAEFAARGLADEVTVANDTFALFRASSAQPWGVAVVCGAGINAVGVAPDGRTARFPALGVISGDWGGGEDLADQIMFHAMRAEDGRGPDTELRSLVTTTLALPTVLDAVVALHFGDLPRERLHALVPVLCALAESGDRTAMTLVERQAVEIVAMAEVCLHRLDLQRTPTEVVLGGGLLAGPTPVLVRLVAAELAARAPQAIPVIATRPPLTGAILAGLDRLKAPREALARAASHGS
ncbi:BadF/BadG/BcrA/BcrD ATPase family protein [Actinocorallia lasiicapitis]